MTAGRYLYQKAATTVLLWLHLAEEDLLGHLVITTGGETGEVLALQFDEHHGFTYTFDPIPAVVGMQARRWYPVSNIKTHGPKVKHDHD